MEVGTVISLDTIEKEIRELESRGDTTYSLCERLAWLYIVRDHLLPEKKDARTQLLTGSDFLEAASGVPFPALMKVLDEHVSAIQAVSPKAYEELMAKISELR
jgi:hypothetical protein